MIGEKPVTAETEFTAKKSSGKVEVAFTFDATSLEGKTTVIFEELSQDGQKLAVHADLKDTDQQVSFPSRRSAQRRRIRIRKKISPAQMRR